MRFTVQLAVLLLVTITVTADQVLFPLLKVQRKRHRFGDCKCYSYWPEVQTYNKATTDSINITTLRELDAFGFFPDSVFCCQRGHMAGLGPRWYDVKKMTNSALSFLYSKTIWPPGELIPRIDFLALNFDPRTGQRLRISQALNLSKKASLDSVILQRLAMVRNCKPQELPAWLTSQIAELEFVIEDYGITLLFHNDGQLYYAQPWTFEELSNYMRTEMFGYIDPYYDLKR